MHCAKTQGYELYISIFDKHKLPFLSYTESFLQRSAAKCLWHCSLLGNTALHSVCIWYIHNAQSKNINKSLELITRKRCESTIQSSTSRCFGLASQVNTFLEIISTRCNAKTKLMNSDIKTPFHLVFSVWKQKISKGDFERPYLEE